ncbi:MAG: Asp23/Gls24 family envelope stress response protein [Oscillospiraceae bacterium]|nr:Asp23/Gls24 family envelope stress response protein [Oscillospiraceae bacterium]
MNNGEDVAVELGIMVKRNTAVHKVGTAVQDAVKSALEGVTGAKVSEVNVQILGVQL